MARDIVMPSFGMYTAEATVVRWLKPSGASVDAGEPVLELETEKALAEVTAPEKGILHHVVEPGTLVLVEALLGYVLAPGEAPPSLAPEPSGASQVALETPPAAASAVPARQDAFASPNARRAARELGVDLAAVAGTGPGGRITEDDVRAAVERRG
jgi:pyruvate dehydrogenase E2 component (dihydrolipoamide acetyltransferase)